MSVLLRSAFWWSCPECGYRNFEVPREGEVQTDQFQEYVAETLDAVEDGEEAFWSEYLVIKAVMGPAFVKCLECKGTYPATLGEDDVP